MKSLRSSSLPILMAILVLASLRPVAPVEAALDLALVPSRLLAELALPLRWLRRGTWTAGDEVLAAQRKAEGDAGADLVLDLRAAAEPTDPDLRLGRRLVPAEVFDRHGDSAWVELDPRVGLVGLRPGLPVVVGEAFVGRVAELDEVGGWARIELATGRSFFVGAVLEEFERARERIPVSAADAPQVTAHPGGR